MNGEVLRGEVYWLKDRDSIGVEERLRRPVVIVSSEQGNRTSPSVIGVCVTTKQRWGVINVPVRSTQRQSWVMCNQVYCLDKIRLDGYICTLTDEEMVEVDRGLKVAMGLFSSEQDAEELEKLHTEIDRLKAELEKAEGRCEIEGAVYKRLYERALDELVAIKFSYDMEKAADRPKVEETPKESVVVEKPKEDEPAKLVEVNTCTIGELRQIGVDVVLANAILRHRPYRTVDDLKMVPGMKSVGFAILKSKVCCVPKEKRTVVAEVHKPTVEVTADTKVNADTNVNVDAKVNVNTATVAEMMEKVGMVKQLASAICLWRKKNGKFEKIEDLLKIPRFGTGCMEKYGPRLEV